MSRSRGSRVAPVIALFVVSVMASLYGQGQSQARGGPDNQRAIVAQSLRGRIATSGSARVIVELKIPGGPQPEALECSGLCAQSP